MKRIALTQGDPHGIGPEICAAALARYGDRLMLCGDTSLNGPNTQITAQEAGARSAQYVRDAVAHVQSGRCSAIVTAPINKAHWHAAGITAPGHTEFLAQCVDAANPPKTHMLFWTEEMRVALTTLHTPLRAVAEQITSHAIRDVALATHVFLQQHENIANPRLACLGLNPHAGEDGLLGWEEQEIIAPAILQLQQQGIDIDGPHSADTFFGWVHQHASTHFRPSELCSRTSHVPRPTKDRYDCVIAMYHDQGLIPIKTLYPNRAVNVTMGLPFIRTSVGHGTAEDIAGSGQADPRNLFAAIECALALAQSSS